MNRLSSDHEQTQQWTWTDSAWPWTDSAVTMNRLSSDHEQTQQWPWTDSAVTMNRLIETECHIFLSRVIILLPTDLIFTAAGLKCRVPESLPLLHHSADYICGSFGIDELILGQLYTYTPYSQISVRWRELRSIYHYCSWTVSMKPHVHEKSQWNRVWYSLISCECAPSEDSDQPGHPPSLIRVFAVRLMGSQWPNVSSCGQRRLWSDWADAQADLSLRWAHTHFVRFVMRRLIILGHTKMKYYA